ncbi:MAG: chorismate synthase [Synechococcales cyanobacterium]
MAQGNSFGSIFTITTYGESHGGAVGVIVDGCPPRLALSEADIQVELDRRRPGQSAITTPRQESDRCTISSGVFRGYTTGTPIHIWVPNQDARSQDYSEMATTFRPSHADATYEAKYGIRNWQGGGRSSARETIGRVAAGAIAKKILRLVAGVDILAYVKRIQHLEAAIDPETVTLAMIEANPVRCPDAVMAADMEALIIETGRQGDSLGGVVECVARQVPRGLGCPVFDKLEADLAKALMSLPATKGFEIGSGFAGTYLTGREHNDAFRMDGGQWRTATNRSGGIQGGISNGEDIILRVAFKPTATIRQEQATVTTDGQETTLKARGRHDPCVLPRAVPMVEAMVALVLCDHLLRQQAQCSWGALDPLASPAPDAIPEQTNLPNSIPSEEPVSP